MIHHTRVWRSRVTVHIGPRVSRPHMRMTRGPGLLTIMWLLTKTGWRRILKKLIQCRGIVTRTIRSLNKWCNYIERTFLIQKMPKCNLFKPVIKNVTYSKLWLIYKCDFWEIGPLHHTMIVLRSLKKWCYHLENHFYLKTFQKCDLFNPVTKNVTPSKQFC